MKILINILLVCIPIIGFSQSAPPLSISLQDAIRIGIESRNDINAKTFDEYLAANEVKSAQKKWIPNIEAEGNIQYNIKNVPTYIPEGFAGLTEPQILSFGAKNQSIFGLSLDQVIYKPQIGTGVKVAKTNLELQKEKNRGFQTELRNSIAGAYFNVLLKKLQYKIAQEEENRFKEYEVLIKGKYEHGSIIKNKYLQAQLDTKNAKTQVNLALQDYLLAYDYLKYQINFPKGDSLILTDSTENLWADNESIDVPDAIENRTEMKQLEINQTLNNLQLIKVRQAALPTVSLQGYYAQMYQNNNFNYGEGKWWAPHSYIGLNIHIPILENFINSSNIQHLQLQQKQLNFALAHEQSTIEYQINKTRTELKNAKTNRAIAFDNYTLSQTIYKNQEDQFALGEFEYSSLLDTEKSVYQAEQNYIVATYNFLVAALAYEKAIGKL